MKTKTIPDWPILIGELIRRRPVAPAPGRPFFSKSIAQRKSTDSPLNAIESEYECSSSESATSPRETKTLFSDRQEQAKGLVFCRFAITKFFYRLVMNKQKRH
jgi:hypothetical protein